MEAQRVSSQHDAGIVLLVRAGASSPTARNAVCLLSCLAQQKAQQTVAVRTAIVDALKVAPSRRDVARRVENEAAERHITVTGHEVWLENSFQEAWDNAGGDAVGRLIDDRVEAVEAEAIRC